MDVLSSQATIAGYSAVLKAAQLAPRMFPMLTTSAGTLDPARVVVLGAGAAGLQATATARRLGAHVEVYEPGSVARETVESLGAELISADAAKAADLAIAEASGSDDRHPGLERLTECLARADVVISTVALPGISAPKLISEPMLKRMQPGSVIVDLAAESGGNCELTVPGETVTHTGVIVDGPLNLASDTAHHASVMYAHSLLDVLDLLIDGENIVVDRDNEVIDGVLLTHAGKLVQRDAIDAPADADSGD